jgi:hypothetical protein
LESRKPPPPAELSRAGRELFEAGRPAEAWEFFKRADDRTALEELRQAAVSDGDFFLYTLAAGVLGTKPDPSALRRLADNARQNGRDLYADKALAAAEGKAPVVGGKPTEVEGNLPGEDSLPEDSLPGEDSLPA